MAVYPSDLLDAFLTTHSRVVRLFDLPPNIHAFLASLFLSDSPAMPAPQSLWTLHDQPCLWAVFNSHEEACAVLSLRPTPMSIAPALESDLYKLYRFQLAIPPPRVAFPLSSNPPNPRSNFRLGDWICSSPKCAAHNFGRNVACIGCGGTRRPPSPTFHHSPSSPSRPQMSPRFASSPIPLTPNAQLFPQPSAPSPVQRTCSKSGHPLLTPSGREFAVGGRVQNVSADPLTPCIVYWPDNEAFPEPGQIRPNNIVGVPQPPILNTGNRGPIAHQPGDWICQKCNYLNWRRRKVCQTCFPYAEGNGDSISAAVQTERIALLTSVLSQQVPRNPNFAALRNPNIAAPRNPNIAAPRNPNLAQVLRAHSVTPPQAHRSFVDVSPPHSRGPSGVVHRSQSQVELGSQYMLRRQEKAFPIYQTSAHRRPASTAFVPPAALAPPIALPPPPAPSKISFSQQQQQLQNQLHIQQLQHQLEQLQLHAPVPAPLLPSFLQDIVHSPTLSPSSTSSADLSLDEYDDVPVSPRTSITSSRSRQTSSDSTKMANIWRMDGEETRSLSAFSLPNTIVGSESRKSSLEKLRG